MAVDLYHNPRCSKSRATLALLEQRGVPVNIIEYLKVPLDPARLLEVFAKLNKPASAAVRISEAAFADSGLDLDSATDGDIAAAIVRLPQILQRPIVVTDQAARIGRPPEDVLEIL